MWIGLSAMGLIQFVEFLSLVVYAKVKHVLELAADDWVLNMAILMDADLKNLLKHFRSNALGKCIMRYVLLGVCLLFKVLACSG